MVQVSQKGKLKRLLPTYIDKSRRIIYENLTQFTELVLI